MFKFSFVLCIPLLVLYDTVSLELIVEPTDTSNSTPEKLVLYDENTALGKIKGSADIIDIYTTSDIKGMGLELDTGEQPEEPINGVTQTVILVHKIGATPAKHYAMKCFAQREIKYFKKELRFLHAVKWDYIADLAGYFKTTVNGKLCHCYLLHRYKGSLATLKLNDHEKLEMFIETVSAVDYLHKNGIAHRDVKAGNVMVDEVTVTEKGGAKPVVKRTAKLIDFDAVHSIEKKTGFDRTFVYSRPPESVIKRRENVDGIAADYWGLGILLLSMWTKNFECRSIFDYIQDNQWDNPHDDTGLRGFIKKTLEAADAKHKSDEWSLSKQIIEDLLEPIVAKRTENFEKVKALLVSNNYKAKWFTPTTKL